ncbi:leucine-rich repeats and immunoglobulin-like domains protein 3 [Cimex lectularius]|uniref:Ig-like domain-containing protein n=1 Tax=Cimex lectularius TaxID=79782 RepID=A0A8I6R6E6_CIMLE|nr:leucine-rich repeats and immunoglobulin-like domains protein 3 [Cimex lectularius]
MRVSLIALFVYVYSLKGIRTSVKCHNQCSCLESYVDCSDKQLTGIPDSLPNWAKILDLSKNSLHGPNVSEALSHYQELNEIKLDHNEFTFIPIENTMHNLISFSITHNKIKMFPDHFWSNVPKLISLDVSHNELSIITPGMLVKSASLTTLKIDNNYLIDIPIADHVESLTTLSLAHNKISQFPPMLWENLPKLSNFDISYNDLTVIGPEMFSKATHLSSLNLNNNKISSIKNGSFSAMNKLTDLKLSKNNLLHLKKETFRNLTNLKKLELNKNALSTIEGLTFKGLDKLIVLKIRQNPITTLQDGAFWGLHKLQILKLDHNDIKTIWKGWTYGLESLQELYLSHNKIHMIYDDSLDACKHLLQLDLSNNELTVIKPSFFKGLEKLKKLKLDGNKISTIAEGAFISTPSLEVLELNHNCINWIIEDMSGVFFGLKHLKKLGLAANQITSINQKAFVGLTSLTQLDLSSNLIKTIQDNTFGHMPLSVLTMNTSSLLCDCNLVWLSNWIQASSLKFSNAYCDYPEALKGKLLVDIPIEQLLCLENDSPKPIITEGPKSSVAVSGKEVKLSCHASSSSNSSLNFKWKRNNDDVTVQHATAINNTSYLIFSNVELSHAGKYQCIVSNRFGTSYSEKATLSVLVMPVMTKKPVNVTVRAGSTVKLECAASGEPIPQVGWRKDGGTEFPAAQERRMHVMPTDDVFYIVNAKPTDSGLYSCIAKNAAGTVMANTTLTVHEAPSFIKKMEDIEVGIGKTTVLECMGSGWPKPKLRWWKDGVSITPGHRHILTADDQLLIIMDVKSADAGVYQCEITNSLGTEKSTAQLVIAPAYSATADNMTGVIIITVVCCAVGTSAIWVIIIYQTRKRFQINEMAKPVGKLTHLDNKSEHSASSKDSGTGDSTKRSSDEINIENSRNLNEYRVEGLDIVEASFPLLSSGKNIHSIENANDCCCNHSQRQHTRNNHDRCKNHRPYSMPAKSTIVTSNSIPQLNSYMCLYVAPKPTPI